LFFFSSRRRHTRCYRDWSSDVCSSDLGNVVGSEIELRGYIISGERDRLARAQAFLGRAANLVQTLRDLSGAIPDQMPQVELLGALIGEEFERFGTLSKIHGQKGVSAAIRTIGTTASAATSRRIQLLTTDRMAAGDARLARRAEQSNRGSDLSVITAACATLFNLGLRGFVVLLVRREIKDRQHAEEVVKFAATHDPLTGLPNRLLLTERVNRALATAKSEARRIAMLFIDLDRFKNINDTLGHEAGDRLLQNVANRLASCVRRSDTVARQGGDEFVVLIEAFQGPGDLAR